MSLFKVKSDETIQIQIFYKSFGTTLIINILKMLSCTTTTSPKLETGFSEKCLRPGCPSRWIFLYEISKEILPRWRSQIKTRERYLVEINLKTVFSETYRRLLYFYTVNKLELFRWISYRIYILVLLQN